MELAPDDGTIQITQLDDQLIFSEAQLAESLGDPQDEDPATTAIQQHEEDMEVDGIVGDGGEGEQELEVRGVDESLLDTTDEGGVEILETIVEEHEVEQVIETEIVQQDVAQVGEPEGEGGHVEEVIQIHNVQHIEPEEPEPEAPCNCPSCLENSDENGCFKGVDERKAKCLICYATISTPDQVFKRIQEIRAQIEAEDRLQQELQDTVEHIHQIQTQEVHVIGEEEEGRGETIIGVEQEDLETQKIELEGEQDLKEFDVLLQTELPAPLPGIAGSVVGIKSEARELDFKSEAREMDLQNLQDLEGMGDKDDMMGMEIMGTEEVAAAVLSENQDDDQFKDLLKTGLDDGEQQEVGAGEQPEQQRLETQEDDDSLKLDLIFKVLSCSFDDLDQDVDLLVNFVPLCENCQPIMNDALVVYKEIQKLEVSLTNLRESIKSQVSKSFDANFCKRRKPDEEILGYVGQIDATRRAILGEDCPAIARLLNYKKKGRRGRKPVGRKSKSVISKSALYPQVTLDTKGRGRGRGRSNKSRVEYDAHGVKQEFASEPDDYDEDYVNDDGDEEHEVIQTHSGRKVKKPNYKKWLLGDDEDEEPGPIVPGVSLMKAETAVERDPLSPTKSEQDWSPGHSDDDFQAAESDASSSSDSDMGANSDDDFDDDEDFEDEDYDDHGGKRRKSDANRIPCGECSRTFADEEKKERHFKRYHEPGGKRRSGGSMRIHHCDHCDKEFKRPNLLKRHLEKDHGITTENGEGNDKKKHICEFCGQKYRNGSELRVHVRLHTGETPFKCDHCDQSFVSALKRETHIEQCHWEIPPLKCEFCDRAFFRQHRLRIHRITHTGERAYLCEICSQSFSHPTYLKYHQGQHAELNMESYKCKECGKQFANPTNLKLHVKTVHLKEFRFSCEVCGMGFTHMSHKRIHMRGHTGERPYKCEICGESFRYKDRLRIHLRGHTGERPFVCDVCKKGFASRSKLKRHEKIHEKSMGNRSSQDDEPQRPLRYTCDDCGKAFAEPQHLSAHRRYCQRKNFGEKDDRPKATKSAPGKIKATASPAPTPTITAAAASVPATATVQKIQIEHIPAHAIQAQQTQMLVPVTYTAYPVTYGYEVTQQYQQQPHASNVRDYPNYN